METILTHKTDSHHTNLNYQCLLVDLTHDPRCHVQIENGRVVKIDWMPTDIDVLDLNDKMFRVSPTFRMKVKTQLKMKERERNYCRNRIDF